MILCSRGGNMKVLIYDNKAKDEQGIWLHKLVENLVDEGIEYQVLTDENLSKSYSADALFVLGGDGTVLFVNEFANRNNIPIIGINAGKLGFLSEFECYDMKSAVTLLKNGDLKRDERSVIELQFNGQTYCVLNEVFIQRIYIDGFGSIVTEASVYCDGLDICDVKGDGIIICTQTGSTAYSLSAGGSILAPGINAFSITPIAAHGLSQRPIICSADSKIEVKVTGKTLVGLFVDGKFVDKLEAGQTFKLTKAKNPTVFLRKTNFDFFKRLKMKLGGNGVNND
ncbi:MAG: NAD(+)/NADH kinase [Clostridiales bacterium]|nr:NAD(+)/NADH kinase [Clostridiales bacterium]